MPYLSGSRVLTGIKTASCLNHGPRQNPLGRLSLPESGRGGLCGGFSSRPGHSKLYFLYL
jgi:hypothetical protein